MSIKKQLIQTLQNLVGVYFGKVYSDSELKVSAKEVGGKVEKVAADGSLEPAEDGDYVMTDGFSFTVKDGQIVSIVGQEEQPVEEVAAEETPAEDLSEVQVEVPAEESSDETPAEDLPESNPEMDAMKQQVAKMEERLSAIEEMLNQMMMQKESDNQAIEQFNKTVAELNDNIKTLAKVPVEFSKTNKTPKAEEVKQDKMIELANIFSGLKK